MRLMRNLSEEERAEIDLLRSFLSENDRRIGYEIKHRLWWIEDEFGEVRPFNDEDLGLIEVMKHRDLRVWRSGHVQVGWMLFDLLEK